MNKTIKYGGLVGSLTMAAFVLGASTPASAVEIVDANCVLTDPTTIADDATAEEIIEAKSAQAIEQAAVKACFEAKIVDVDADDLAAAKAAVAGVDTSEEAMIAELKAATYYDELDDETYNSWERAASVSHAADEAGVLAYLRQYPESFNVKDIFDKYDGYAEAEALIAEDVANKDYTTKANEAGAKAATLRAEATAAEVAEVKAEAEGLVNDLGESEFASDLKDALANKDSDKAEELLQAAEAAKPADEDVEAAEAVLAGLTDEEIAEARAAIEGKDTSEEALIAELKTATYYDEGFDETYNSWERAAGVSHAADEAEVLAYLRQYPESFNVKDILDEYDELKANEAIVEAADLIAENQARVAEIEAARAVLAANSGDEAVADAIDDAKAAIALLEDGDLKDELSATVDVLEAATEEPSDDPVDPSDNPSDPSDKPSDPSNSTDEPSSDTPAASEDTEYTYLVLNGYDQVIVSGNALTVRFDAPVADFLALYIDGELVDAKYYTVKEGSTIVTLTSEYLDTLEAGLHVMTAQFAGDNYASVRFTVADTTTTTASSGESTGDATTASAATPDTGVMSKEAGSAVSGILATIAAATLAGSVVILRKRVA